MVRRGQELATDADRHARSVGSIGWISTAATAYHHEVARDVADLRAAALQLEQAGWALIRHAQTVQERTAAIARIEHEAVRWFTSTAHSLVHGVEHAAMAVANKVLHVAMPRERWHWRPDNLPPLVTWRGSRSATTSQGKVFCSGLADRRDGAGNADARAVGLAHRNRRRSVPRIRA